MRKIYCFGNPYVSGDTLALELADSLKVDGFEFVKCTNPAHLPLGEELFILDVVKGIKKVGLLLDLKKLEQHNTVSAHDLALGHWLQMGENVGLIKGVKIIGLPLGIAKTEAKREVELILKGLLINKPKMGHIHYYTEKTL